MTAPMTNPAPVCVLSRDGGVSLDPLAPDALARALEEQLAPGLRPLP